MEENFGTHIRKIRERRDMSQRTLAIKAKTSQSAVARIEGGDIDPRISTIQRLLKAMDSWLMVGYDAGPVPAPTYYYPELDDEEEE